MCVPVPVPVRVHVHVCLWEANVHFGEGGQAENELGWERWMRKNAKKKMQKQERQG